MSDRSVLCCTQKNGKTQYYLTRSLGLQDFTNVDVSKARIKQLKAIFDWSVRALRGEGEAEGAADSWNGGCCRIMEEHLEDAVKLFMER